MEIKKNYIKLDKMLGIGFLKGALNVVAAVTYFFLNKLGATKKVMIAKRAENNLIVFISLLHGTE